jgi:hypothetical protein
LSARSASARSWPAWALSPASSRANGGPQAAHRPI